MIDRFPHDPTTYDDLWEDPPKQGWLYKWVLGVAVPLYVAGGGVVAMMTQSATYWDRDNSLTLHGRNAIAFGIAWLSAAIFLHCHYFWGNVYDQAWFAVLGKIVSACAFIAGLAYVLVRFGVFGIV